ncbi:Fructose-1-phosphate phosphatase [Chlorella sorokiniana]|uniref:Fructose-1-phosphate phosphatase n=1 Tax=Chlorella sorokiniana TaxID=3076 RepID=A0A2P6TE09_CHLSO|nr:Fructose-1-phosphate phosphatase [Chlorella sorokiniana]|eukprot:PRW20862.1 Fructose-1-phosphate phosphatase [Chlorella sorokiniana]
MQRPEIGGPGLVRVPRQPKPVRAAAPPPATPPVVWVGPPAAGALTLAGSSVGSCSVVIDTEFVVLPPQQPAAVQPNTTCLGIVWQGTVEGEADAAASAAAAARGRKRGRHPRRTQTLRFTCNLCGETNDCEVNPHAWNKGSVFARCQGCTAVHKLRDNLKIFHELAGPVFPPRDLRSAYLVQEILDRIAENNRN